MCDKIRITVETPFTKRDGDIKELVYRVEKSIRKIETINKQFPLTHEQNFVIINFEIKCS